MRSTICLGTIILAFLALGAATGGLGAFLLWNGVTSVAGDELNMVEGRVVTIGVVVDADAEFEDWKSEN